MKPVAWMDGIPDLVPLVANSGLGGDTPLLLIPPVGEIWNVIWVDVSTDDSSQDQAGGVPVNLYLSRDGGTTLSDLVSGNTLTVVPFTNWSFSNFPLFGNFVQAFHDPGGISFGEVLIAKSLAAGCNLFAKVYVHKLRGQEGYQPW